MFVMVQIMTKPFVSRGINDEQPLHSIDDGENVTYVATVVRETTAAVLCEFNEHKGMEKWIPKSCIHDDSEVYAIGHSGKLIVKSWFALKELSTFERKPTKSPRPELPVEMSADATTWLDTLRKRHPVGVMTRPCKALVELEQRGCAIRSGGPGVETVWKIHEREP